MNRAARCGMLCVLALAVHPVAAQDDDPDPAAPQPIRVGVLHSLTGTMAISEKSLVDAVLMAIDEVNQRGGILGRPLEPVVEDGASDWPTFARKAEKLIVEDNVASIFGCWTSASRIALLPVLEEHDHLLWYPLQYEGQEASPHVIYTGAAPNQQIIPAVDWCSREFGTRMFLVGSDYVFPRTANQLIKLRLQEFGVTPVGEEYRPLGSMQFKDVARRIDEIRPDVVLNTINGTSNLAFFQALREVGLSDRTVPVVSFSIAEDELRHIGVELTSGHYCSWSYFQSLTTPANLRFVRDFRRRYGAGRVTDDPIEAAYSQVHMFARAVEKAGSTDVEAIRTAARGLIYSAPGGLVRIDPQNQHTWKVSRIGRIQPDGQFKIVWSSKDPLPPRPFVPELFLASAEASGSRMFREVTEMIDTERSEPATSERRALLISLADVRGFLGNVRAEFRTAVLVPREDSRERFDKAWSEFELRWGKLAEHEEQMTDAQRTAFADFREARETFHENADSMFAAIYPAERPDTQVTP